jgi:glutamyl-Q tRNA(Asp) synthetase
MEWDGEVVWQSRRKKLYEAAFKQLEPYIYACGCTRKEIADSQVGMASDGASLYPGICRRGLAPGKSPRAYRLRVPDLSDERGHIEFTDRWSGRQIQDLANSVGDFILKRADGFWAYQLAVVVDDAEQGITHIVRGADLLESTARQIYLQRLLGIPTPEYLHVPVVTNMQGEKLSKQTGAQALDIDKPIPILLQAAAFLELPVTEAASLHHFWELAIQAWKQRFGPHASF